MKHGLEWYAEVLRNCEWCAAHRCVSYRNIQGSLLADKTMVAARWKRHFEDLLNVNNEAVNNMINYDFLSKPVLLQIQLTNTLTCHFFNYQHLICKKNRISLCLWTGLRIAIITMEHTPNLNGQLPGFIAVPMNIEQLMRFFFFSKRSNKLFFLHKLWSAYQNQTVQCHRVSCPQ